MKAPTNVKFEEPTELIERWAEEKEEWKFINREATERVNKNETLF